MGWMEWMDGGGRVISLCVVVVVVVSQVDMGGIPGVDCWLCMANIVGSFVILSQCMESLRGDSSNFSVCSYLLFRFGPEMGAYPIYFSFWWLVLHPIKLALSLSLTSTCLYLLFSYFFSLFSSAICCILFAVTMCGCPSCFERGLLVCICPPYFLPSFY